MRCEITRSAKMSDGLSSRVDGDALHTEREMRKKLGKSRIGARAAGR